MRRRLGTTAVIVAAALAALAVPVAFASRGVLDPPSPISGGTGAYIPTLLSISTDGGTAVFSTTEAIDPRESGDVKADLYAHWPDGSLTLLTPGVNPTAGSPEFVPWSVRVLADGTVAFLTQLQLAREDTDRQNDVYFVRPSGKVELISAVKTGAAPADLEVDSFVVSGDRTTIAFTTREDLLPSDTQPYYEDVYRYAEGGELELVTVGDYTGWCDGLSHDGTRVYWESSEPQGLGPNKGNFVDDDHWQSDLFYSSAPYTDVISPTFPYKGEGSTGGFEPRESPDGRTLVIRTTESLAASDKGDPSSEDPNPATLDVYLFSGVSKPPQLITNGENIYDQPTVVRVCNGGTVVVRSYERMVPSDIDSVPDVYRRTATGARTWMTPPSNVKSYGVDPVVAASSDCRTIAWTTTDRDAAADTDWDRDVYMGTDGGTPQLISITPPGRFDGPVRALVTDKLGRNLLFTSRAQLTPADADRYDDVYEWDRELGGLSLVSSASSEEPSDQKLITETADGDSAFVMTNEPLGDDTDGVNDIYRYAIENGYDPYPVEPTPSASPRQPVTNTPTEEPTGTPLVPALPTPVVTPVPPLQPAGSMAVTARQARVTARKGRGTLSTRSRVRCAIGGASCQVSVRVTGKRGSFATHALTLKPGAAATIAVPLRRPALERLRKARKLTLTVSITVSREQAEPVTRSFKAQFRRPR